MNDNDDGGITLDIEPLGPGHPLDDMRTGLEAVCVALGSTDLDSIRFPGGGTDLERAALRLAKAARDFIAKESAQ